MILLAVSLHWQAFSSLAEAAYDEAAQQLQRAEQTVSNLLLSSHVTKQSCDQVVM